MEECVYTPKNADEVMKIASLSCIALLNLALCFQYTKEWTVSIAACDSVLSEIDDKCVKALYRRAQVCHQ
mgnify:CR=1 FL=1